MSHPAEWDEVEEGGVDWLDSRSFYELMQEYRHDPIGLANYFEGIKWEIRERFKPK